MRTIEISEETYKKIKDQLLEDRAEEKETKLEIKTFGGSVLFSSTKTTIKEAVEEAVSEGADLEGADLRDADLRGADLRGADLRDAYLRGADLRGADLRGADLRDAYLEGADLMNAKFYGKGGMTKIKKNQVDNFLKALGIIVE